jgi:hypothetical protein
VRFRSYSDAAACVGDAALSVNAGLTEHDRVTCRLNGGTSQCRPVGMLTRVASSPFDPYGVS